MVAPDFFVYCTCAQLNNLRLHSIAAYNRGVEDTDKLLELAPGPYPVVIDGDKTDLASMIRIFRRLLSMALFAQLPWPSAADNTPGAAPPQADADENISTASTNGFTYVQNYADGPEWLTAEHVERYAAPRPLAFVTFLNNLAMAMIPQKSPAKAWFSKNKLGGKTLVYFYLLADAVSVSGLNIVAVAWLSDSMPPVAARQACSLMLRERTWSS